MPYLRTWSGKNREERMLAANYGPGLEPNLVLNTRSRKYANCSRTTNACVVQMLFRYIHVETPTLVSQSFTNLCHASVRLVTLANLRS